jgi:hypothetical protein
MANFQDLIDFVDIAVKSRKYPENTAYALKAALNLFETELNDEERQSLDIFRKNFEQINTIVFNKNNKKFSANSLNTYKYRVMKVLSDYETYGINPTKMASWTPKVITRGRKEISRKSEKSSSISTENHSEISTTITPINMHRIELALRTDTKAILVVPKDITEMEASTLKAILDSLTVKNVPK